MGHRSEGREDFLAAVYASVPQLGQQEAGEGRVRLLRLDDGRVVRDLPVPLLVLRDADQAEGSLPLLARDLDHQDGRLGLVQNDGYDAGVVRLELGLASLADLDADVTPRLIGIHG